ncbi:oxidoreductase [Belnapia sp. T6]|uniref:Oxidoreductase n=1 Tax=Belnapia mucosa TaxID=2804532 RepID=A0ABS1V4H3_9PROT|nr:oxidoreductase [Belnapia mucosa]
MFELARPDGRPLPAWDAGSHVDLHLPNGLVRQYSLLGSSDPGRYLLGVKRDPVGRGGSAWLHDKVRVGDVLQLDGPRNHFPLAEQAAHSVLIAGGIGITPLLAMAARLQALGSSWTLHHAVRSRGDAAFTAELAALGGHCHLHCDDEAGAVLDIPALVAAAPAEAHLYCCGPAPMLASFEAATAGRPPDRVHVEYFTAKAPPATQGGFTVELARSRRELRVAPGQSILDTVLEAGIDCGYACMQGTCGSCEARVLAGEPDHRDGLLPPERRLAEGTMLICCSGSRGERLVLDL